jgi:aryl-alcohol dehydrogenase-like predicted oxidoreductase
MTSYSISTRQLGKDGPIVPALGFGLMGLAGAYGAATSEEQKFQVLDRAFELGNTFWDNSEYALSTQGGLSTILTYVAFTA